MPKSVLAARSWNPPGPAPREHLAYISDDEARMIDTGPPGPTYRVSNGRRMTDMPMNSPRPRNALRQMAQKNWLGQRPQRGEDQGQFRADMRGWIGARPFGGDGAGHIPSGGGGPEPFPFPGGAEGGFPGDFPFPGGAGRDMGGGGDGGGGFPGSMPPGWGGEARGFGHFSGRQGTQGGTGGGRGRGIPSFAMANTKAGEVGYGSGSGAPGPGGSFDRAGAYGNTSGYTSANRPGAGSSFGIAVGYDRYGNRITRPSTSGDRYSTARTITPPGSRPTQNMPRPTPEQWEQLEDASAPTPGYYNMKRLSWAQAQKAPIGTVTINSRGQTIQKTAGGWAIIGNAGTGQRYAHQGAMQPSTTGNWANTAPIGTGGISPFATNPSAPRLGTTGTGSPGFYNQQGGLSSGPTYGNYPSASFHDGYTPSVGQVIGGMSPYSGNSGAFRSGLDPGTITGAESYGTSPTRR